MELRCIETLSQLNTIQTYTGLSPLDPQSFMQHSPDAHWVLIDHQQILARCSLWWKNTPLYSQHQFGFMGHYQAQNLADAHYLLDHTSQQLKNQGCTLMVAPIDGNTWRRYRLITDRGDEPPFFLEPDHPDEWVQHFLDSGFTPFAHYSSTLNTDLTQVDPRLERVKKRLAKIHVEIQPINRQNLESELKEIYTVSLISFRNNFLYSPISESEFMAQYTPILPNLKPELVLLAKQQGKTVGFLFAIPDFLQAKRGQAIDTVIIKTVASLPHRSYAGLGNFLISECQNLAVNLGYKRVIHALMHDENKSRNLSLHYAKPMRRYSLFAKAL